MNSVIRICPKCGAEIADDASEGGLWTYLNGRRSHDAVIRVYDESGNVIQTHEHTGDFKAW